MQGGGGECNACLEYKGEECQREGELQDGEDGGAVGVVGLKGGDCT